MTLGINSRRPDDAVQEKNGHWLRPVTTFNQNTGAPIQTMKLVCEDCWEVMPNYAMAPSGYVSPESNSKLRASNIEGHGAVEAVEKCVCYDCWRTAFERCNPASIATPEWEHGLRE